MIRIPKIKKPAMALASGKRAESLTLAISTPSDNYESVMYDLVQYARDNPGDRSFRYIEFAAPEGCAVDDRSAWRKANPAIGSGFLDIEAIAATLRTTPEPTFRRFRLGQWTSATSAWLPFGAWAEVADIERGTPPKSVIPPSALMPAMVP